MKKLLLIVLAVILLGIAMFFIVFGGEIFSNTLEEGETAVITVEAGDGTIAIGRDLKEQGVIAHEKLFRLYTIVTGHNGDWVSGEFTLEPGMGFGAICDLLTTAVRSDIKVVLVEGKQARQMAQTLEEAGICSADGFMEAVSRADYDFPFLKGIDHENPLEGYLFPDTYYFEKDTDPRIVVETMLRGFEENMYREEYIDRAEEMGYSFDEMIILASVVESESSGTENMKKVAGVFYNRLNNPDFPRLQSCVTVEYAMGVKKSIITYEDTQIDSPYNTYKYPGLPIGPISNPGIDALEATLYPAEHDYYYFQSDQYGNLYFAETVEEHDAIKSEVQADWDSEVIEVYGK